MSRLSTFVGVLALLAAPAAALAQSSAPPQRAAATLPRVVANDNRTPAGAMRDGVTEIRLVAQLARWFPAGERDSSAVAPALAEEGRAPSIPAPLVRVPTGRRVRFLVRNALPDTFFLCVRGNAKCASPDTLRLAPGASGTLELVAGEPGVYTWYGALEVHPGGVRRRVRGQMAGAFVVEAPGKRGPDRVIVVNGLVLQRSASDPDRVERFILAMNGMIWPHTERFSFTVGDTVDWAVVIGSEVAHPMHLHGFYFDVLSRGDGHADTVFSPATVRMAVTEGMVPMSTMRLRWIPQRAGNWLFHCHRALHVAAERLTDLRGAAPLLAGPVSAAGSHLHGKAVDHARDGMSGMVMGIEVRPRKGSRTVADTAAGSARRRIRLLAQQRPGYFGRDDAMGFTIQDGEREPSADSLAVATTPLVLQRDEPVSITVVNRMRVPTSVHWHGIELESFFDGVGGWSGYGTRVAPMIAPADSFIARFTPPRPGTFIYHAHGDEMRQLGSGLIGALVVLDKGQRWSPETDHIILIGQNGPGDTASITVNGRASHASMELKSGVKHRFRIVSIAPQDDAAVALFGPTGILRWRAVAKDGADLPPALAVEESAYRLFGPGETFDFEIVPKAGERFQLGVMSFTNVLITLVGR